MKKFDFKRIGMRAAGVAAGAGVSVLADTPMRDMNPKLKAGIKILVGAVVPELMPKSPFVGSMGDGILAGGAIDLMKNIAGDVSSSAAPVEGIGAGDQFAEDKFTVDTDYTEVSGTDEDPMNGIDDPMNGIDDPEGEED